MNPYLLQDITSVSVDFWPNVVVQADRLLKGAGLCNTESEARDIIGQGRANVGEYKIKEWHENIKVETGLVLWVKDGPARIIYL